MGWNKVQHEGDLPRDQQFLAVWRGITCLAEYDEELCQFWISYHPAQEAGFILVSHDRVCKFSQWMFLPNPPLED